MIPNRNLIYLNRPASILHEMWMDAFPIGDGITGALIFGAVAEDTIIFTRHDLWRTKQSAGELPNVSPAFFQMRERIDSGDYPGANDLLHRELVQHRQDCDTSPFPLGKLQMTYQSFDGVFFRHYCRGIDLEHGSSFVSWEDKNGKHNRTYFISKESGLFYCDVKCETPVRYFLDFNIYKRESAAAENSVKELDNSSVRFCAEVDGGKFGIVLSVECVDSDGTCQLDNTESRLEIIGKHFTVKAKTFAKIPHTTAFSNITRELSCSLPFADAYRLHSDLFSKKFNTVSIELAEENDPGLSLSNRALLDLAYDDTAPVALLEKLWRYARYLFLSGTATGGNPFSLYGIWFGDYNLPWASNVSNENIEMIYWHVLSGGMADSLKDFIHYFFQKIPACQQLAEKMFACRGIFLPAYSHPETIDGKNQTEITPSVPVICNWISGAGWISLHFYQYYQYTHDSELLNSEILPFMIEAARFYSDYTVFDKNGKVRIYPSVSPENTPGNLMPHNFTEHLGHICPVAENATMDLAVIKSLYTNLFRLLDDPVCTVQIPKAELDGWHRILSSVPEYSINQDGAIQEWTTPKLTDFYQHRHFSHIFPLFPGDEISRDSDPRLVDGFRRAVELRPHGAQSGWSFAHVAEIWERLGNGEKALENLNFMIKGCVLDNFFTLHNDWRHMGASVVVDQICPVQFDALMGYASAIQDTILQYHNGQVFILPALPQLFTQRLCVKNLRIPEGSVSVSLTEEKISVLLDITAPCELIVHLNEKLYKFSSKESNRQFSIVEER